MMSVSQKERLPLRQLIVHSPQLTILSLITLAMFVAMVALVSSIVRQANIAEEALGYNVTDVTRPFVQLQRESLRLMILVAGGADQFDAQKFQLQTDLLLSRFNVIDSSHLEDTFAPETRAGYDEILSIWDQVRPLIAQWKADPTNTQVGSDLTDGLTNLEFVANRTEIRYQQARGELIAQLGASSQSLIVAVAASSLILVLFSLIVTYSIYRFILARRVAEDQAQAAQAAEAVALEANRFKDEFLATMSHELRTPLNAIIGFLGLMTTSETLDQENSYMAERARANADRLLLLIKDILDLSKIQSGRLEFFETVVSPRQLAQEWESQTSVLAQQKGVAFSVSIDPTLPKLISVDRDAVTKIATNLLSNAFKFTESGRVDLKLKGQKDHWIIEVTDTGIGIPADKHALVFESFRQVDSSYQRSYGGTGLGLAIVDRLVKALNGSIRLASREGQGSTFTVTLPLHPAHEQTRKEQVVGVT
jgi:signal transduction histidine kinase